MAAYQKRLLTAENSRLGKVDIVALLRRDDAWVLLSRDTREHLYSLLPPEDEEEGPRDPDINPLAIKELRPYIEAELKRWQDDLREGRETKKWRNEAMQAGKDDADGNFDEWKFVMREEYWGKPGEGKAKAEAEKDESAVGEDKGKSDGSMSENKAKTTDIGGWEKEMKDSEVGLSEL